MNDNLLAQAHIMQLDWTPDGSSIEGDGIKLWCALTGQQPEQVANWGWLAPLRPHDQLRIQTLWEKAVQNPHLFRVNYNVQDKNGIYHKFRAKYMPLFTENQTLRGWLGWLSTVTSDVEMPEEVDIWKRNFLYHLLYEPTTVGSAWLALDGQILQVNDCFCDITGYSREECQYREMRQFMYPDDRNTLRAFAYRLLVQHAEISSITLRMIRKDRHTIWVNMTFIRASTQWREPKHFIVLVEDVSEREQIAAEERQRLITQEKLAREAEQRAQQRVSDLAYLLEAVFRSMLDGVLVLDTQGIIIQANEPVRQILELPADPEFIGKDVRLFMQTRQAFGDEGPLNFEQRPVGRVLAGEIVTPENGGTISIHLQSGQERRLNVTGTPVHDQMGLVLGYVLVFHDISEHWRREKRVLHTLNSLFILVKELPNLLKQTQHGPQQLEVIGKRFSDVIAYALHCEYVSVTAVNVENGNLHLLGVTGMTPTQEQEYRQEINNTILFDYFDEEELDYLYTDQVISKDLNRKPYHHHLLDFGIKYRLIAPMFLNGKLVALFAIAKTTPGKETTQEEMELVKAITHLAEFFC